MKRISCFAAVAFSALLVSFPSLAGVTTISTRTETNAKNHATFVELKKKVTLPGAPSTEVNWMTDIRFAYAVSSAPLIENLAIVQWIHGCVFQSEYLNGKIVKTIPYVRTHFGQTVPFQHRTWQLDSDTLDAAYTSDESAGRFALLRWNQDPKSLDPETATFYAKAKPPHGSVFATDLPASAFLIRGSGLHNGAAQNASLEYLTCLFKSSDVPEQSTPSGAGLDQSKALWCAKWDHKFTWDFTRAEMVSPSQIDPVCLAKP